MKRVEVSRFPYRWFPILVADVSLDRLADATGKECKQKWKRHQLSLGWHNLDSCEELTPAGEAGGFSYIVESSRTVFYTQLGMLRDISKQLHCSVLALQWSDNENLRSLDFFLAMCGELRRLVRVNSSGGVQLDIGLKLDSEVNFSLLALDPQALDAALMSAGFPRRMFSEDFLGSEIDCQIGWDGDPRDMLFPPTDIRTPR